jgi:8-oxo-dGTP diphosphatase
MEIQFLDANDVDATAFKYAVIAARYRGKWVFCKNTKRKWEIPGGHREEGETALEAAKRELFEETGAIRYTIQPVTAYRIHNFGMLFYAEIEEIGDLPESEIERIDFFDKIPDDLSFPAYHPAMIERVKSMLKDNVEVNV